MKHPDVAELNGLRIQRPKNRIINIFVVWLCIVDFRMGTKRVQSITVHVISKLGWFQDSLGKTVNLYLEQ